MRRRGFGFALRAVGMTGWLLFAHRFTGVSWEGLALGIAILWAWADSRP